MQYLLKIKDISHILKVETELPPPPNALMPLSQGQLDGFCFPQSGNYQNTGQNTSLFNHFVCNRDVKADTDGARLFHQSAYPGDFMSGG